jgi:hypothetical protein
MCYLLYDIVVALSDRIKYYRNHDPITIQFPPSVSVKYNANIIQSKCNFFYGWKHADLVLNNNHSLN